MLINLSFVILLISGKVFADEEYSFPESVEKDAVKLITEIDMNFLIYEREYIDAVYNLRMDERAMTRLNEVLDLKDRYSKIVWPRFNRIPWQYIQNKTTRRLFKHYSEILSPGVSSNKHEGEVFRNLKIELENSYIHAQFCDYHDRNKCDLREPEISAILTTSRDPEELEFIFTEWYNKISRRKRDLFREYIRLSNKEARMKGYPSARLHWLSNYGGQSFADSCRKLLEKIMPLYKELHAYTRYKLRQYYGGKLISKRGPLPGHLLGNIWGLNWLSLKDILLPYPELKPPNVTEAMLKKGFTPLRLYKMAEDFFVSLNMSRMVPKFWEKSIFKRPDLSFPCAGHAWDMFKSDDFRITFCTQVTETDLAIVHHEMGHIQYYMAYKDKPFAFRDGANYAFHEGVGDSIALSVLTNKHLRSIGLIDDYDDSKGSRINFLMSEALVRVVDIPFTYLLDLYRWQAFDGEFSDDEYNCKYWELKVRLQGIAPPKPRSERYTDVIAKYHVANDRSYIRYFGAAFLQFQFFRALCEKAGQFQRGDSSRKLYDCDFYGSTEAGNAFMRMLSQGSSRPWPDVLEEFTGSREMEAEPILEYFEELYEWLKEYNKQNGVYVGWETPEELECD